MDDLCTALTQRLDYFAAAGCRVSDHGLDFVPFAPGREGEGARALSDALAGRPVTAEAAEAYQYALLAFLAQEYARRGWVMQLHYGALRNVNSAMFARLGPDTGYDCIGSPGDPARIAGLLDTLDRQGNLPKTILYSANGRDTAMLGTLIQCFQRDVPGKLQLGAAWWFNDTKSGIVQHLVTLAEQCLLGNFVGMLTDSRSFLSYTRHEYFRRLLCNQVAQWVDGKEAAMDPSVGRLIEDISYYNISRYIGD